MNSTADKRRLAAGARLREARKEAGFDTAKEAAEALSVPYQTYQAHEKGTRGFGDLAELYAKRFKVNLPWLALNTGPMKGKNPLVTSFDPEAQEDEAFSLVEDGVTKLFAGERRPLSPGAIAEIDLRPGAGGGGYAAVVVEPSKVAAEYPERALKAEWILPPSFIQNELNLKFGLAEILQIRGDSMFPDLADGDRVICDRADTKINQGGIFAIWDGDTVIVKQVELVRDADRPRILCTSRNEKYKPFNLDLTSEVYIIGRIVLRIARM